MAGNMTITDHISRGFEHSASKLRSTFDDICKKYDRKFADDDIVDIYNQRIIKDRGTIRHMRKWKIGHTGISYGDKSARGSNAGLLRSLIEDVNLEPSDSPDSCRSVISTNCTLYASELGEESEPSDAETISSDSNGSDSDSVECQDKETSSDDVSSPEDRADWFFNSREDEKYEQWLTIGEKMSRGHPSKHVRNGYASHHDHNSHLQKCYPQKHNRHHLITGHKPVSKNVHAESETWCSLASSKQNGKTSCLQLDGMKNRHSPHKNCHASRRAGTYQVYNSLKQASLPRERTGNIATNKKSYAGKRRGTDFWNINHNGSSAGSRIQLSKKSPQNSYSKLQGCLSDGNFFASSCRDRHYDTIHRDRPHHTFKKPKKITPTMLVSKGQKWDDGDVKRHIFSLQRDYPTHHRESGRLTGNGSISNNVTSQAHAILSFSPEGSTIFTSSTGTNDGLPKKIKPKKLFSTFHGKTADCNKDTLEQCRSGFTSGSHLVPQGVHSHPCIKSPPCQRHCTNHLAEQESLIGVDAVVSKRDVHNNSLQKASMAYVDVIKCKEKMSTELKSPKSEDARKSHIIAENKANVSGHKQARSNLNNTFSVSSQKINNKKNRDMTKEKEKIMNLFKKGPAKNDNHAILTEPVQKRKPGLQFISSVPGQSSVCLLTPVTSVGMPLAPSLSGIAAGLTSLSIHHNNNHIKEAAYSCSSLSQKGERDTADSLEKAGTCTPQKKTSTMQIGDTSTPQPFFGFSISKSSAAYTPPKLKIQSPQLLNKLRQKNRIFSQSLTSEDIQRVLDMPDANAAAEFLKLKQEPSSPMSSHMPADVKSFKKPSFPCTFSDRIISSAHSKETVDHSPVVGASSGCTDKMPHSPRPQSVTNCASLDFQHVMDMPRAHASERQSLSSTKDVFAQPLASSQNPLVIWPSLEKKLEKCVEALQLEPSDTLCSRSVGKTGFPRVRSDSIKAADKTSPVMVRPAVACGSSILQSSPSENIRQVITKESLSSATPQRIQQNEAALQLLTNSTALTNTLEHHPTNQRTKDAIQKAGVSQSLILHSPVPVHWSPKPFILSPVFKQKLPSMSAKYKETAALLSCSYWDSMQEMSSPKFLESLDAGKKRLTESNVHKIFSQMKQATEMRKNQEKQHCTTRTSLAYPCKIQMETFLKDDQIAATYTLLPSNATGHFSSATANEKQTTCLLERNRVQSKNDYFTKLNCERDPGFLQGTSKSETNMDSALHSGFVGCQCVNSALAENKNWSIAKGKSAANSQLRNDSNKDFSPVNFANKQIPVWQMKRTSLKSLSSKQTPPSEVTCLLEKFSECVVSKPFHLSESKMIHISRPKSLHKDSFSDRESICLTPSKRCFEFTTDSDVPVRTSVDSPQKRRRINHDHGTSTPRKSSYILPNCKFSLDQSMSTIAGSDSDGEGTVISTDDQTLADKICDEDSEDEITLISE